MQVILKLGAWGAKMNGLKPAAPALALAIAVATIFVPSSASAESCLQYLAKQFVQAKTNASNCGVSADLIGSIDQPSQAPGVCSRGARGVQSQLGAFQACAAVYYCATEAYRCAVKAASAGADCQSAMQRCMQENPIPQIQ